MKIACDKRHICLYSIDGQWCEYHIDKRFYDDFHECKYEECNKCTNKNAWPENQGKEIKIRLLIQEKLDELSKALR